MSRLFGVCLFAALLGVALVAPRATAKPPDLPTPDERVEPPAPPMPELIDAFLRGQIISTGSHGKVPDVKPMMPYTAMPAGLPVPPPMPGMPMPCFPGTMPIAVPPPPPCPPQPSLEGTCLKCLLGGLHPLLGLLPCDDWLGLNETPPPPVPVGMVMPCPMPCMPPPPPVMMRPVDINFRAMPAPVAVAPPPAATGSLKLGIGVNSELKIKTCCEVTQFGKFTVGASWSAGEVPSVWCHPDSSRPVTRAIRTAVIAVPPMPCMAAPVMPPPMVAVPVPAPVMPPACPYLRQQQAYVPPAHEVEIGDSVLANLKKLKKAARLIQHAKELGDKGDVCGAIECLEKAARLCPGRYEEMAAAIMEQAFVKMFGTPAGTSEEQEEPKGAELLPPPTPCPDKHEAIDADKEKAREMIEQGKKQREIESFWSGFLGGLSEQKGEKSSKRKEKEIEEKLCRPVSLSFDNVPLRQAIDDIRAISGLDIWIDGAAMEEAGFDIDSRVTFKVEDVSLKSALKLLLRSFHLTYVIRDEAIAITTEKEACGKTTEAVKKLLAQCHFYMMTGHCRTAAALARMAFALNPEMVVADPLVYKLHLMEMGHKKVAPSVDSGACTRSVECPCVKLQVSLPAVDATVVKALDDLLQDAEKAAAVKQEPKACAKSGCPCAAGCKACEQCCKGDKCCCADGKCDCPKGGKCCCEDGKCACAKDKCRCEGACKALGDADLWMGLCRSLAGGVCHDVSVSADGVRLLFDFTVADMHYRIECDGKHCNLTVCPVCIEQE